jgi:hypothetical protein
MMPTRFSALKKGALPLAQFPPQRNLLKFRMAIDLVQGSASIARVYSKNAAHGQQ